MAQSTARKYLHIQNQIQARIDSGEYCDRLPGERQLCEEFDASYMTVRRAVEELVSEGVLLREPGVGTFVAKNRPAHTRLGIIGFYLAERVVAANSDPYYSQFIRFLEQEVQKSGANLMLFTSRKDLFPFHKKRKVDGLIATCFPENEPDLALIAQHTPLVLIDNAATNPELGAPSVIFNNRMGAELAVNHLILQGHRRIACLTGFQDNQLSLDRLDGYRRALLSAGISYDEALLYQARYSGETAADSISYFLNLAEPPTAYFCESDIMAAGVIKGLREAGLNVPQDCSVTGFDDIPLASQIYPALTTIHAPLVQMAAEAMRLLNILLAGRTDTSRVILNPQLIIRNSTAQRKA